MAPVRCTKTFSQESTIMRICLILVLGVSACAWTKHEAGPHHRLGIAEYEDTRSRQTIADCSFRAIRTTSGLFLRPVGDSARDMGPFTMHDKEGLRYVFIPKDRPQEFGAAMQIYRLRNSNIWYYTDNWMQMSALRVDPNGVLPRRISAP